MKINLIKFLMGLVALLIFAPQAHAQRSASYDFSSYGVCYKIISEDDCTVEVSTYGKQCSGDIEIPEKVTKRLTAVTNKTYTVIAIGNSAFSYNHNITSVAIPKSVTTIGKKAFFYCSSLTSVIIPSSVTTIGDDAFYDCGRLTSVTIPSSVTTIANNVFHDCSSLTSVTIPNSVTTIGNEAFWGCCSLTSVTIPNSVTAIGKSAFTNCSGLTSVTIPNSVTTIGKNAFANCSGLTSVTIGNSVTTIGDYAFQRCNSLNEIKVDACNSTYASREGVLYTKDFATLLVFPGGKTGSFIIPNSVTEIYESAFLDCSGLTSVIIPNSVSKIGTRAFAHCSSLTSVTIPESVTIFGTYIFAQCTGLTSAIIHSTEIGSSLFSSCQNLTSVTMTNVTEISDYAFQNCSGLTSVIIPNTVTNIGRGAFSDCSSLTTLSIPSSVTSLSPRAFQGSNALREIYCHWEVPPYVDDYPHDKYPNMKLYLFGWEVREEAVLYVPKGCVSAYEKVDPWRKFWNIEEASYSGITETSADGLNISVTDGVINIDCAGSETLVEVFDIAGKTVYRGYGHTVTGLSNGIYIVKVGSQTRKIRI